MAKHDDSFKEKFRPASDALDHEVEAALAGVSIDDLYNEQAPPPQQGVKAASTSAAGLSQ